MENLIVIKTLDQFNDLKNYLIDKDYIAFDTETTGIVKDSKIIGFSISAEIDTAYYVVLSYYDNLQQKLIELETTTEAINFLASLKNKKLIMHNAVFDCWMVENNYKVSLIDNVHTDTMILGHILDENRSNGLKELGVSLFGEDVKKEQQEMKESVIKNGGMLTKSNYELYKADSDLIGKYGAKDALLTLKIFYTLIPQLYEEGLDKFFYDEECMPLLRGPTYQLNTRGLRVDPDSLQKLKGTLESECMEARAFINKEISSIVADKYPGTNKSNGFNIGSSQQLSWLLFIKLENYFGTLTKEGKELCKALNLKLPYANLDKRIFIEQVSNNKGKVWHSGGFNYKTKKVTRPKKIGEVWRYFACGKETLNKLAQKYKWVEKYLEYKKNLKLLNTYVEGIQERMQYNIIRPSFLQIGTTSGRYSSKNPNFQNLPRNDKRVKSCIVSRPGKVFVGADYSQLEPRVFASFSNDTRLLDCFKNEDDFYSVIGVELFDKQECSLKKDDHNSFAIRYPKLRDIAKVVALSATYGTTAPKMALTLDMDRDRAQDIINDYFEKFPSVQELMLDSHMIAKKEGKVPNLFGRPRRIPKALEIDKEKDHADLPYEERNLLNLAMNHRIQSTSASIVNRASIAFLNKVKSHNIKDCYLVLQIHDELIAECWEENSNLVVRLLKESMQHAIKLPNVDLIAEPKIAKDLAQLK